MPKRGYTAAFTSEEPNEKEVDEEIALAGSEYLAECFFLAKLFGFSEFATHYMLGAEVAGLDTAETIQLLEYVRDVFLSPQLNEILEEILFPEKVATPRYTLPPLMASQTPIKVFGQGIFGSVLKWTAKTGSFVGQGFVKGTSAITAMAGKMIGKGGRLIRDNLPWGAYSRRTNLALIFGGVLALTSLYAFNATVADYANQTLPQMLPSPQMPHDIMLTIAEFFGFDTFVKEQLEENARGFTGRAIESLNDRTILNMISGSASLLMYNIASFLIAPVLRLSRVTKDDVKVALGSAKTLNKDVAVRAMMTQEFLEKASGLSAQIDPNDPDGKANFEKVKAFAAQLIAIADMDKPLPVRSTRQKIGK